MKNKIVLCVLLCVLVVVALVPFNAFAEDNTFVSRPCVVPFLLKNFFSPDETQVIPRNESVLSAITLKRVDTRFVVLLGQYTIVDGLLIEDYDEKADLIESVVDFKSSNARFIGGSYTSSNSSLAPIYYFETVHKFHTIGAPTSELVTFLRANPNARPERFTLSFTAAGASSNTDYVYTFSDGNTLSFRFWLNLQIFYKFDGSNSLAINFSLPCLFNTYIFPTMYEVGEDYNGTYENGFASGYESAMNTVDVNSSSYRSGYNIAKNQWFNKGYSKGISESQTLFGYLSGVAQAPINFLRESLSFEILGVSIYDFVCSILTVCALLVVVKAVSGV